ncbi:regulatory protein VanR (plasmid) [Clostridium botulinum A2B7 92]|uniref:transcriptional regulator n=1 Tax=Clostridium botulinum TaxID=1491 RepID=UPI0007E2409B|nr:transcriptional regulator [Clostridium botulinum]KEI94259.1 regulatory protein VanR [Clostridium botulinum A2B7 92]
MNKKKITAIIIACVVIVGGIAVGLNKSKDTKAVQNTQKKVVENKENQKPSKQTQNLYKDDITVYKGDAKVDYSKEKTVIHIGNEKILDVTNTEILTAQTIFSPNKEKISGKEYMDLNMEFLTGKSKETYKNIYAFKQKSTLGGSDYMYFFIKYKGPFAVEDKVKSSNTVCTTTYAKVVSADENGIKLDNGQYFNIKKDSIPLSFVNERLDQSYDGASYYTTKYYPQNTLVKISKENNEIKGIQKIAVLF